MAEAVITFVVRTARDLPKTDTFSAIDPFVKISTTSGSQFETKHLDDNANPRWDQAFVFKSPLLPDGRLGGSVELTLFDEDPFKDSRVGQCTLDFSSFTSLSQLSTVELPLHVKDKYNGQGKSPVIVVGVSGAVRSFGAMHAMFFQSPGVLFDAPEERLYLPQEGGRWYLGIEYERSGKVDFKIFTTAPGSDQYYDIINSNKKATKIRRRVYHRGQFIVPGLVAYQEIKLDDVPMGSDFNRISVICCDAGLISENNVGQVANQHGWRGALNFDRAVSSLRGIEIDHGEHEVGMHVEPGESVVVVDWDEDNVDMKLAVIPSASTQHKGYDLTIRDKDIKKTSEFFNPPKTKFGRLPVNRIYELDDVPHGTKLNDMSILIYNISNMRQYTVQQVTSLMI